MGYRESLEQVQSQRLQQKLSPAQVRYVRMLEMTGPEIEEEVRREIDDNPALERADDSDIHDPAATESAEEMRIADYRGDDDIPSYRLEARNHSADDRYREPVTVAGSNLSDYLLEQLGQSGAPLPVMEIAPYIIGNLDRNGYLRRELTSIADDIAMSTGIDIPARQMQLTLDSIRALDPPGIGAADLRDCLLLQLKRRRRDAATALAIDIIENHFDTFSRMHFDRLESLLGIDRDALRDAVNIIRSLNPKPAAAFEGADDDTARAIIPDFSVEVEGDTITLSSLNNIPELRLDATFADDNTAIPDATARRSTAAAANAFITERRDRALEFMRMLRQRQETLFRVMSAIIKIQRDFFLTDDETRLRPMVLRDIAAMTGYDLSVISRATAGKYVATRGGIYPLKFFFNESLSPVADDNSDSTSTRSVMAALNTLIDNEDPKQPLSDNALTEMLNSRGIPVARRTVSKYRERLGIPVARLRRKL